MLAVVLLLGAAACVLAALEPVAEVKHLDTEEFLSEIGGHFAFGALLVDARYVPRDVADALGAR